MSRPTSLYRFFDQNHQLLYVGITYRIEPRFSQHRQEKPWDQIATVTVEHHPTRDRALEAERAAIQSENPKWNVVHNTTTSSRERPMASSEQPDGTLVGHAFHIMKTHEDGCTVADQQGHIVGQITDDAFLAEFFSWWSGEPTHREVVTLAEMAGWRLYGSIDWMRDEWKHGGLEASLDRHLERHEPRSVPAKGEAA